MVAAADVEVAVVVADVEAAVVVAADAVRAAAVTAEDSKLARK